MFTVCICTRSSALREKRSFVLLLARSPEIDTGLTLEAEPETVKLIGDMSNQQTRSRMLEQLRQELAKVPVTWARWCPVIRLKT